MKRLIQISLSLGILSFVSSQGTMIGNPSQQTEESCPENMIHLLASEDSTEMICDCKPKFLYHRENDSCHEAYKKGPCPPGHYFVLPAEEISGKCVKNPCVDDGLVQYQGNCARIGNNGSPCKDDSISLDVNDISFELECKPVEPTLFFESRLNNAQKVSNNCPRGSRRIYSGKCKHIFQ